jgi:hypothetical protein
MDVGRVSGLDGTRGETSFQAAVIAANAEPAANVESDVTQVARCSRRAPDDYAIDQRCGPNARTQSEQNYVSSATSRSPQDLADQGRARVVVGAEWQTIHADKFAQQTSFQKIQIAGQAVHTSGGGIDDPLAADPDSEYWTRGALADGEDKIMERRSGARRILFESRQQIAVPSDQSGLHHGRADVNADRDCVRMSCCSSFAHNDSELYSRRSFAAPPRRKESISP